MIITLIITNILAFALGCGLGYLAHLCKTMPNEYIAPDENPK